MSVWEQLPTAVRYVLSFVVPLLATLTLTPVAARIAHRFDVLDHPGGHKVHREATPYLGGLAVAAGLLLIAAFAGGANGELLTVLIGALVLALVGLTDDVVALSPFIRLAFETVAGVALWIAGVRAGLFHLAWADLPLTVFWVIAVTNAVNVLDNMDGVASAVAAASTLGIAAIAGWNGDFLVTSFALAVAGACVGFLRYNFPPASIFLGDAGSMLLGFLIAALTLKVDIPVEAAAPRVLAILLLAAVPLFDLSLVVLARLMGGRPVWRGGTDHVSHRLAGLGRSKRAIAIAFAAAQAACSFLAFVVYRQTEGVVIVVGILVATVWVTLLVTLLRMPTTSEEVG